MNIQKLKKLWNSEKEAFKEKEIGALQNFVRKVFECVELFDLGEGKESIAPHDRKNVFIQEDTDNKAKNRPDFVLYLDIDKTQIKIPVEVEKHGNIKAGEKQIKNYKELYNAVYAILTDGCEWRFYDGDIIRKRLRLDEIVNEPGIFKTFWKEYTLPETYYISFFDRMVVERSLFERGGLEVEENREVFFDDITALIRNFKYKLRLSQYFNKEKDPDKIATEISYAYVIQYILYKTLVDNDYSDKKEEFLGRFKEVYKSLKAKIFGEVLTQATHIAEYISKNLYRPFSAEQKYIEERLNEIKRQPKKSISNISPWLDIFVFIKKYNFATVKNELFGYIYENYLKELYQDKNKGQYFTDPAVVEFMLDEIGYTTDEIKKRIKDKPDNPDISIIDPACGSGTFLYSAAQRIIEAVHRGPETAKLVENLISENIFGLDIAVFPLYLAEMGILMKMLPLIVNEKYNNPMEKKIKLFKTDDSIAEFVDMMHSISEKDGQKEMFPGHILDESKFMRDEDDLAEMKGSMRPPRRRFDFVIGNPPYIGYNECCKQKILFTYFIKESKLKLNDVYGVNLHSIPANRKKYRPNPNLYAFFIALGLSLLKNNSRISYIIPQNILTAGDLDVIRYHLSENTSIEKLITFAGKMFIGRGLKQRRPVPTSSLIFVSNSHKNPANIAEIINYGHSPVDNFQDYFLKVQRSQKYLQQSILRQKIESWTFIKLTANFISFYGIYNTSEDISLYYDHHLAKINFKRNFYFDGGYSIDEKNRLWSKSDYMYPHLNNRFYTIKENNGFWPNIRDDEKHAAFIGLRQGNQGYNLLDQEYKIIWSYANSHRFHFTSLPVIWARNQFNAIGSNHKTELLYLFSLLNSSTNILILHRLLKTENEKDFLLSTTSIKNFVRVPKITKANQLVKDEIIKRTEQMLDLEDCQLQDLVDFSDIKKQKFDRVEVKGTNLILTRNREQYKAHIRSKKDVVKAVIEENYGEMSLLPIEVALSELRHLMALDRNLQESLKDYIDDLVFALYYNVPVRKVGCSQASQIRELCRENRFYDCIQTGMLEKIK